MPGRPPIELRLHCIEALGVLGDKAAGLALSALAEDEAPIIRTGATLALDRLATQAIRALQSEEGTP